MASADRPQAHDLSPSLPEGIDLRRAGLFAVVRLLEARAAEKPRLGRAKRPEQSIVDLAQEPSMAFEGATLAALDAKHGASAIAWLLAGPSGPDGTDADPFDRVCGL